MLDHIKEAIVLAGGLGTRLRSVVAELPKPMAPIQGKPFLSYLLDYLANQGVRRVFLSVGYKAEVITEWLSAQTFSFEVSAVVEDAPLGTGGAIAHAWSVTEAETVAVMNGDTFFPIRLSEFFMFHKKEGTPVSLALARISPADRYGVVELEGSRVKAFQEKVQKPWGWIYGGIALIESAWWKSQKWPEHFSWEAYLTENAPVIPVGAYLAHDVPFIDIGLPEDYRRAQYLVPQYAQI
ncbi:MAG: sugar phosphate nucleotidyltransferase [Bacteroidia bacterium]|nr:sugar phosphate nucleotidyltransferase [Bacteroidia bacterium]MDW8134814.1 sugar phosphate nucleotidyltransferase [Bacteroidia bacterium]